MGAATPHPPPPPPPPSCPSKSSEEEQSRSPPRRYVSRSLSLARSRFARVNGGYRARACVWCVWCVCARVVAPPLHVSVASSTSSRPRLSRSRRINGGRGVPFRAWTCKNDRRRTRFGRDAEFPRRARGTPSRSIMRDMAGKIAELKFEAPLARFEEEDTASLKNMNLLTEQLLDASLDTSFSENCNANEPPTTHENGTDILQEGTFSPFSGSLEDLVNTFDEKITSCFRDYGTDVESLAPVQVRTQEEIMNECQMWWTITGTFGNILPIDWSKSYARKMHMPALNLNEAPASTERPELEDLSSEDEAVATDLDMHALILSSSTDTHSPEEPMKTAEEVLREIDDIMQESPSMERSPDSEGSLLDSDEALERSREVLGSPLHEKKLKQLSSSQLTELFGEMESLVAALSETLIAELALRDELEYEKELKNQFISLLLAVQNRRRQHHVTKKRNQMQNGTSPLPQHRSLQEPKYLTTVIPYHTDSGPPDNQALQVLIKILKAISEDSPTVPTLLTDYILKVLCPT
ncbi:PREDICTED: fasciculation and elongation protein zeta-2 [Wasmannia auropunctata]|uniref:fasciculation and elongation protein zeta-2 n=1 Tax=Wasmannia auropunctata TaxID=64793 RepID=UPI0005EF81DB|nr:PREDICTED: fasciculation and elongation protein zeta-2 [Wasmannia auropunctata]